MNPLRSYRQMRQRMADRDAKVREVSEHVLDVVDDCNKTVLTWTAPEKRLDRSKAIAETRARLCPRSGRLREVK